MEAKYGVGDILKCRDVHYLIEDLNKSGKYVCRILERNVILQVGCYAFDFDSFVHKVA